MPISRRTFVQRALQASACTLPFVQGGVTLLLTPAQARARSLPYQHLHPDQARVLGLLGETILPGAVENGMVYFIDHQLGVDPDESLLMAKYLEVTPPYGNFYGAGIDAASALAERLARKPVGELSAADLHELITAMATPDTVVDGFPVFTFYVCLRSDAVDAVYGTPEGFKKLNVPYMAHIMPPEWDDGRGTG